MFTYEAGVLVAIFVWVANVVAAIIALNSLMERNLNIVGQRLSWLTMRPIPVSVEEHDRSWSAKWLRFCLLHATTLLFVACSWLYVIYIVGALIYSKNKDSGAPEVIRNFRWKLKNRVMTVDEVIKGFMVASEVDPTNFGAFKSEYFVSMNNAQYAKQDEANFREYERKLEQLRVNYHFGDVKQSSNPPPAYLREEARLNLDYEVTLRRGLGWTDAEFNQAKERLNPTPVVHAQHKEKLSWPKLDI